MRKENEIYCSNCGVLINKDSRFCPSCGLEQLDFQDSPKRINSPDSTTEIKEIHQNFVTKTHSSYVNKHEKKIYMNWWFWAIILLIVGILTLKKEKEVWNGRQFVPQSQYNKEFGIK